MIIKTFNDLFSIYKVKDIDNKYLCLEFSFIGISNEEKSLICKTNDGPKDYIAKEDNYRLLMIESILDFNLIGIIARISDILAKNNIPIIVESTYNTDYFLVKDYNYKKTINLLIENDYEINQAVN